MYEQYNYFALSLPKDFHCPQCAAISCSAIYKPSYCQTSERGGVSLFRQALPPPTEPLQYAVQVVLGTTGTCSTCTATGSTSCLIVRSPVQVLITRPSSIRQKRGFKKAYLVLVQVYRY